MICEKGVLGRVGKASAKALRWDYLGESRKQQEFPK